MAGYQRFTQTTEMDRDWIQDVMFPLCDALRNGDNSLSPMSGKALYCLFYEPSFLTRTSFERACELLGGRAYHTEDASQFFPVHSAQFVDDIIQILASLKMDAVVIRAGDTHVAELAAATDVMHVINGGSSDDHPTQALADLYTIQRERGEIDGATVAIVGRLDHRNVSALLKGLSMFEGVNIIPVPFSGQMPEKVVQHCSERGMNFGSDAELDAVSEADVIYLNGPRTLAHMQLLASRGQGRLVIDERFMDSLKPDCVVMDPMQRSGDFIIAVRDERLAFYRQAENALYARMAVLHELFSKGDAASG